MSPLRNAFARATIKIFPLPLPQPHAESVVNDHGYSLEISPGPTSRLKFKSHAVARFREPGSSSRFCPRARCITQNQVSQEENRLFGQTVMWMESRSAAVPESVGLDLNECLMAAWHSG
jgi:hypothetical protein